MNSTVWNNGKPVKNWIYLNDCENKADVLKKAQKDNRLIQIYVPYWSAYTTEGAVTIQWLIDNTENNFDVRVEK